MIPSLGRLVGAGVEIARANLRPLDRPLKVNLCVTYWCQYRCQTCNIWTRKPKDELTTDELLAFVAKNAGTRWLDVTGGEIFLRDDIGEVLLAIVRTWRRLNVIHFPTNGFLTDRIAAAAARLAAERQVPVVVTVSVDGDEMLNDELRGIKGGYRRQIETLKALRAIAGVRPMIGMTLSRRNVERVESTFEACRRDLGTLERGDFHVNVAQRSSHYYGNDATAGLDADPGQVRQAITLHRSRRPLIGGISGILERAYLSQMDRFLDTGRTPMPCHALRSSCFVDPWGIVFPCISYSRSLGSLRDTGMDLAPIWSAAATRNVQQEIWRGDCPQCWTACEAYQTLLGNALAPWRWSPPRPATEAPARRSA